MCLSVYFYKEDSGDTQIIQYYVMRGLGLCIKLNSSVEHMFYAWSFSHSTAVRIYMKQNSYLLSLDKYNTMFAWGGSNSNKTEHKNNNHRYDCDEV